MMPPPKKMKQILHQVLGGIFHEFLSDRKPHFFNLLGTLAGGTLAEGETQ